MAQCPYKFSIIEMVLTGSDCLQVISNCFDSFFRDLHAFRKWPPRNFAKLSEILWKIWKFWKGISNSWDIPIGAILFEKSEDRFSNPFCKLVQPIPFGDIFESSFSSLNVTFHRIVAKETFELWALSFETAFEMSPVLQVIGCTKNVSGSLSVPALAR